MKLTAEPVAVRSFAFAIMAVMLALSDAGCSSSAGGDPAGAQGSTESSSAESIRLRSRGDAPCDADEDDHHHGSVGACRSMPRPLAPRSMSSVTTRRPVLSWLLPRGVRGAHVDICSDRACTDVLATMNAQGDHVQVDRDLRPGVVYWRLRPLNGHPRAGTSATWEFFVGAGTASCGGRFTGGSMSTTLDVNGDGHADGVVSALTPATMLVFQGGASGLATTPTTTVDLTSYGPVGFLADAGDVDGDGFSDVLVSSGVKLLLFKGGPSGLATTPSSTLPGPQFFAGDRHKLAGGLDFDHDGYDDVLVADLPNERALLHFGSPSGLESSPVVVLRATSPDAGAAPQAFGTAVATAGDVDADGFDDVLVGAPGAAVGAGRAYLFRGGRRGATPSWADPAPARTFEAPDGDSSQFGADVAGSADVDGDGFADLVVGAPGAPNASGFGRGRAYVLRSDGGSFGLPPVVLGPPLTAPVRTGAGVATLGDMNGDGFAEVAVVSAIPTPESGDLGVVLVFGGSGTGSAPSPAVLREEFAGGRFGGALASPGDVDGDALRDLLVGARNSPTSLGGSVPGPGRVFVYPGGTGDPNGVPANPSQTLTGQDYGVQGFGASLD